ncbi:MAG: pyridoxamine kinase [Clostridia bacterium]|nr:pyridoxamine kinase [Clostridia bacterium]
MRVLAINDISCIGKCSLSVSLPIISACGVTCDVLPTALLSTHTGGFEGYTFCELTGEIPKILVHWKTLGEKFEFIYSGYLGSVEQIALVSQIKKDFLKDNGKLIVDPVMGDDGTLYAGFTQTFVEKMRELCCEADYILPNLTEACALAGVPYPHFSREAFEKLAEICPHPIVTGIHEGNGELVSFLNGNGELKNYSSEHVEGFFCGAGDVFASAFVGALARGVEETQAITLAAEFVGAAVARSAKEVPDKRYGLSFEKELFSFLQKLEKHAAFH